MFNIIQFSYITFQVNLIFVFISDCWCMSGEQNFARVNSLMRWWYVNHCTARLLLNCLGSLCPVLFDPVRPDVWLCRPINRAEQSRHLSCQDHRLLGLVWCGSRNSPTLTHSLLSVLILQRTLLDKVRFRFHQSKTKIQEQFLVIFWLIFSFYSLT